MAHFTKRKELRIYAELEHCFSDPLLYWINEGSVKIMFEVARDVFPTVDKEGICKLLNMFWEESDTVETLYRKLLDYKRL